MRSAIAFMILWLAALAVSAQLLPSSPFLVLARAASNSSAPWGPTNISSMQYWWSADDVAIGQFTGPWVDKVAGFQMYSQASATTNHELWGLRFHNAWLTNATGFSIASNSSFWVVYKEVGSDTYGTWVDSGSLNNGFFIRPAGFFNRRSGGSGTEVDATYSSSFQDVFIWANGDLYTNGVFAGATSSNVWSANIKNFGQANSTERILRGYVQDMGFWSKNLSASEIAALYAYSRTNRATNITSGLAAWWKLDESGTNVTDSSGSGWTGFKASASGGAMPDIGGAQIVDGVRFGGENLGAARSTNYIIITNSTTLANGASTGAVEISISIWLRNYTNGAGGDHPKVIVSKVAADALTSDNRYPGWEIHWDDSAVSAYFVQSNSGSTAALWGQYLTQTRDTNWHNYVVVKDATGTNLVQFIDGVQDTQALLVNTGAVTNWMSTNHVMMGWNFDSAATPSDKIYGGWLDDVRIYNRVLSDAEVMSLYKWGKFHRQY